MMAPVPTAGHTISVGLQGIEAIHARLPHSGTDWLGPAEQVRLAGMTSGKRRSQFVAGRWLARQLLASCAGGDWRDYLISAADGVAPRLLALPAGMPLKPLHFSLSHSGDWVACAVSSQPVGIDVECNDRKRDFESLNGWIHEAGALTPWAAMPPEQQQEWFYAQWTLKEAWLKQASAAGAPARPSMKSAAFEPGTGTETTSAMAGRNALLTLAVYPATPDSLQFDSPMLATLAWTAWRHIWPGQR